MDVSKLFTLLCAILLVIALVLSITSVFILKETVEETEKWQFRAQALLGSMEAFAESSTDEEAETPPSDTIQKEDPPVTDADILYNKFYIREVNEKIGVYCDEGQLIRVLDVNVKTLPEKDREKLKKGIRVNSWSELISVIQDYE